MGALSCLTTSTVLVPVSFLTLLFFTVPAQSERAGNGMCSEAFWVAARHRNVTHCKQLRMLEAELGWQVSSFNSQWARIDVVFGARLRTSMGWLAWGVNPLPQPQMIGTRAIIGVRQPNGSFSINTYNITADTKSGCRLLPTALDIEVRNTTSGYIKEKRYFTMSAAVIVPNSEYNILRLNHVWQVGDEADGAQPKMHRKTLQNFDSTETLNLLSEESEDVGQRNQHLRKVHGILNIIGWGTILPVGVIIARYLRKHPNFQGKAAGWWYYPHITAQIIGYALGTAGWLTGLVLGNYSPYYTFQIHRLLAIIIFTFTTLQMLALCLRPRVTEEYRKYWNMYHHFLGYALIAVIILNIFHGIGILRPDNAVWKWAYIGILVLLSAVAMSLEIYSWVKFMRDRKKKKNPKNGSTVQADSTPQTSAN